MTSETPATRPRGVGLNAVRLRHLRIDRMWTQHELAYRAGLSQSMIASLESGYRDAAPPTLAKLCQALRHDRTRKSTEETRDYLLDQGPA